MQGASPAAGAMLGCFGEVTPATFNSPFGKAKLKTAIEAAKMWPDWLHSINKLVAQDEQIVIHRGTYIIFNAKSGKREDDNFSAIKRALHFYNEAYDQVTLSQIPGLNPIDDCRPLQTIFLPNEGYINPIKILKALDIIIQKSNNITAINGQVKKIYTTTSKITHIQTEKNEIIKARTIVLAAGAYSQHILDQIPELSVKIPRIFSGIGCSLLLKHNNLPFKNVVIRSPNRAGSCGVHMMPHDNQTVYMGASNHIRVHSESNPKVRDIYYLLQRATEQFNQDLHKADVIKWQIGNRPVTMDSFPLIGETSLDGLWLLTGTYRDGIHDAPLLAKDLARRILNQSPLYKNLFPAERPLIEIMSKEQSIDECVEQHMSAAYEHNMQIPKLGWDSVFKEMWQERITSLYQELDIDAGLHSDILIMLEQERHLIPTFCKYYKAMASHHKLLLKKSLEKTLYDEPLLEPI